MPVTGAQWNNGGESQAYPFGTVRGGCQLCVMNASPADALCRQSSLTMQMKCAYVGDDGDCHFLDDRHQCGATLLSLLL